MTAHFRNRYFLRLLISYAVAFFALFFALLCVAWVREQRGQRERQVAEVESEARLLRKWWMISSANWSNTCVQLLDNSWLSAVQPRNPTSCRRKSRYSAAGKSARSWPITRA